MKEEPKKPLLILELLVMRPRNLPVFNIGMSDQVFYLIGDCKTVKCSEPPSISLDNSKHVDTIVTIKDSVAQVNVLAKH